MTKTLVLLIGLSHTGVAQAQIKCWTTADGKRACGDTPPPGAKVRTVKSAPASPDAVPASAAAPKDGAVKAAKKGPLTPAEQEQDYRKRQAEAQKAAEKAASEQQAKEAKQENCARSKEALLALESGQRIQRTDSKGERYYLDDAQRDAETAKARQHVARNCG